MTLGAQLNATFNTQQTLAVLGDLTSGLTAAGTNQATALALVASISVVTTAAGGTGVILPTAGKSDTFWVANFGANALTLYPPSGGKLNNGSANAGISVPTLSAVWLVCQDTINFVYVTTGSGSGGSQPYDVAFMLNGAPTATQCLCRVDFTRTVVFAAGLSPSHGIARTAATAQTDLDIQKNGSSVGTVRWAAAGTVASFIMASQTTFSAGDILEVFAPGSPDATLADVGVVLSGTR